MPAQVVGLYEVTLPGMPGAVRGASIVVMQNVRRNPGWVGLIFSRQAEYRPPSAPIEPLQVLSPAGELEVQEVYDLKARVISCPLLAAGSMGVGIQ